MPLTGLDFGVEDDAVEPFLGRLLQQFFRESQVLFRRKTKATEAASEFITGFLHLPKQFRGLLARQHRLFLHVAEVHLERVVQDFQSGPVPVGPGISPSNGLNLPVYHITYHYLATQKANFLLKEYAR